MNKYKLPEIKKVFVSVIMLMLFHYSFAQPTQAEIDKMMKQAQEMMKKYGNDTSLSKTIKNQPQGNNQGATNNSAYADPGDYGNVDNWKFPAKNTALLSSLPKKTFTKEELISFLNEVYIQISKKLSPGISSSVQSIAAKYNNDGNKMGDAAVVGWYKNYREESLLLIIKAAAINPSNGLLINNCAAILNMAGIEHEAIPLLKYALQYYPDNGMLLNNLGQAYAGLGETDTAMYYLGSCLQSDPKNVEANNTAGQIEAAKGNKEKAISYFEQSIKKAYNKPAALKLKKIKPDTKFAPLVKPRIKIPEYFNEFKYKLPVQCTSTANAPVADAEHKAFRAMIEQQLKVYGAKIAELENKKMQEAMRGGVMRKVKKDDFIAQPYHEFCSIMAGELLSDFKKDLSDINERVNKKYYAEIKLLESEYQAKHKALVDGSAECAAFNTLANQYLPKFAALTEDWQKKNILVHQQYFDQLVYWHYLSMHPVSDDNFRLQYYWFISQYLGTMGGICQTKIIMPCEYDAVTASSDSNQIKEVECPLDIEVPFVVGKIELNCEKFSFSAGEGVIFGYERNFKTKQSTLSVGIGVALELEAKAGPLKAGVSAEITETAFISFDGNNGFSDAGIKNEIKGSAGATGIGKTETIIGSSFGIHSGYNFEEGFLKGMIGPAPEVQVNKKINIYKPSN